MCRLASEFRPASVYGTDVAPADTETVVVLVPSVMVAVPAIAFVKLMVPEMLYWLVAELQVPGVTVRATAMVQDSGAV